MVKTDDEILEAQLCQCFIVTPILVLLFIIGADSYVVVNAGTVGIVRTFGAVKMDELQEGFHLKKPFIDAVYHMDCRIQGVVETSMASSQDLQQVSSEMALQYFVDGEIAPLLYQKVGTRALMKDAVIWPAMQESLKAVTAKWTAEELITQRSLVKAGIKADINSFIAETLQAKEITGGIIIANVAITDFTFSNEFNHAIEMKVKAEQEALQAENEMNTTITRAEAQAEKVMINAGAAAYEIEVEAEARAGAIAVEAEALKDKPELLQLRMIERWDGNLPKYNGAGGGVLLSIDD